MKKSIITSLSVLAFAIAFTGCGGSGSVSSTVDTVTENVTPVLVDNGDVTVTSITNEFGLNQELGTPPPLPN